MEIETIAWRSGPDQWGMAFSENLLKQMTVTYKNKLPQPLFLDFREDDIIGHVTDARWDEEDKSIHVLVSILPSEQLKWLGFRFADSIRPTFKIAGHHKSRNTEHEIVTGGMIVSLSMCAAEEPARLPDPFVLYL